MRDIQSVLAALTSPVRREILTLIWERELPAGEIAATFEVTAPTVSQHLSVLRDAGLVTVVADGNFRRYRARQDVLRGLHGALWDDPSKWEPADDIPESSLAAARVGAVVIASVEVDTDRETTFAAFTDSEVYSRWLGVPVTLDGERFSCTMEWGTSVRGVYEVVHPPALLAIRWDFDDESVPVPGAALPAYIRFEVSERGCRVEVDQFVETRAQAEFMEAAWTLVLGRLQTGVGAASDRRFAVAPRRARPKRRSPSSGEDAGLSARSS
jgi:DNA-binding transcriptional ArsR family regulator